MTNRFGSPPPDRGSVPPGGGTRQPDQPSQPSDQDLKAIIQGGDSERLVKWAEVLGKSMAAQVKTSQIRTVFASVRRIEMNWPRHADDDQQRLAIRQLLLLKPKLAYQAERVKGVGNLQRVLTPAIDLVGGERKYFSNFVDFFEAIVAYHKASGARDN